jgi:predicted GNAT family N-acyltransferase
VELIEFGSLTEEQYAELVGTEEDPWGAREHDVEWLEWRPKERHVGLRAHDGRLVAVAGLLVADVRFGEREPIAVVGVGGVLVTAPCRGQGLGERVITEVLERARLLGPDIAMLFCMPHRVGLYRRHGFAEIAPPVLVEQSSGVIEIPTVTMWRPFAPGAELPDGRVRVDGFPF